jgi:hypothetical protein
MHIVDDPTLALIARFVGEAQEVSMSDADFLFGQVAAIKRYVRQFPVAERQARALEWIETYAQDYRQQWQKRLAVHALAQARCPDCPLAGGDRSTPCAVHERWLDLLRRYTANEMSSRQYIEYALQLLNAQKDRLKVSKIRCHLQCDFPTILDD